MSLVNCDKILATFQKNGGRVDWVRTDRVCAIGKFTYNGQSVDINRSWVEVATTNYDTPGDVADALREKAILDGVRSVAPGSFLEVAG